MNRLLWGGLASLAFLMLTGSPAWAQGPFGRPGQAGPTVQPPISPYLNLLNGSNTAVNYYLQVVPQLNRPLVDAQFESQIRNLQRSTPDIVASEVESYLRALGISEPLDGTGHAVRFADTSPYFRSRAGVGQGSPGYRPGMTPGR